MPVFSGRFKEAADPAAMSPRALRPPAVEPTAADIALLSGDPHDEALRARVHPPGWRPPVPAARYDLVVLGGGTAGLVTAMGGAGLGARVALVERDLLGGDCLNAGCVPSKAILAAARLVGDFRRAGELGLESTALPAAARGPAILARMRRVRATLAVHDSADRLRAAGVDVFFGAGRFGGRDVLEVDGRRLRFRRAVIATGARPAVPAIPGLAEAGFRTNEDIFALDAIPGRLAVIGGGPIGCELAQAFARLGATVTLLEGGETLLPREDPDAAALVAAALVADGVAVVTGAHIEAVGRDGAARRLRWATAAGPAEAVADEILVAAGRIPNVAGIGLDAAGVATDARGVAVDDHLRTANRRIFAAGDACLEARFTHAADASARIVLRNALFAGRARASKLLVPRCTYTDPEVAQVGLGAAEAARTGMPIDTVEVAAAELDRAVLDGDTRGFVRVHVRRGSDRIVGATVVGPGAGDAIAAFALAMSGGTGLGRLADLVLPYPTRGEALRKVGDAWNRRRLTPGSRRLLAAWHRLARALS